MGWQIVDPGTGEFRDETVDEAYDNSLHRIVSRIPGSVLRVLDRDAAAAGLSRMGHVRVLLEHAAAVQAAGEELGERAAELAALQVTAAKCAVALNISLQLVAEAIAAREGITISTDAQRNQYLARATAAVYERQRALVGGSGEVH